jgi:dihydropteroate synthase
MLSLEYLATLVREHRASLESRVQDFSLDGQPLGFGRRSLIMGVVNLSLDSWYRESVCLNVESAVRRGKVLKAQGADLVDLGAESTLAQAARVDETTQRSRLLPVIRGLREEGILVSVETYDPTVAQAALKAGAQVLNLTGPCNNQAMFRLAAEHGSAVIICYVQGPHVRAVGDFNPGNDPIESMRIFFSDQIEQALQSGLGRLILDPGLGFYYRNLQDSQVRIEYQMRAFLNTFRLRSLGYPICHALPHAFEYFESEVRSAESFFAMLAVLGKTDLLRTHEVARVRAVVRTLECYPDPPPGPP